MLSAIAGRLKRTSEMRVAFNISVSESKRILIFPYTR